MSWIAKDASGITGLFGFSRCSKFARLLYASKFFFLGFSFLFFFGWSGGGRGEEGRTVNFQRI